MREPFSHDIRSVLVAPGKGLSLKKIFVASFYLLIGYLIYLTFTYLALLSDGVEFDYIWQSYGMFPFKLFPYDSLLARIVYLAGTILVTLSFSLAIMAGSVITFEEMRGNHFFSASKAVKFAFGRISTLLTAFVTLGAFVGFICFLGFLVGLLGRIPVIGEWLIGVFYVVPIFITLAFVIFVIFVLFIAVVLLPVIIDAQKKKEVFDSLLQLFSVLIKEPLRFVLYLGLSVGLAKASSFVMTYLFYRTHQLSQLILTSGGGKNIESLFSNAYAMLPMDSPVVSFMTNFFPGIVFGFDLSRWGAYGGDFSIGTLLLAISLFLIFVVLCGYMMSVLTAGLARGYAVIRRMKDDHIIATEEPMETSEEYANPPFQSTNQNSQG